MEWLQRRTLADASGANDTVSYTDLLRAAETGKFDEYHRRFMFGSVADNLAEKFGTKGSPISLSTACASGATRSNGQIRRADSTASAEKSVTATGRTSPSSVSNRRA